MSDTELQAVLTALRAGNPIRARRLVRPLLRVPTADRWYVTALLCETPEQAITALERVLALDPNHPHAHRRLNQLRTAVSPQSAHETISEDDLPPLAALVVDEVVLPTERPYQPERAAALPETFDQKVVRTPRKRRTIWRTIVIASLILGGLSSTYFVLLVIGSGIPGQLRGFLTGVHPVFAPDATVVYATPVAVIDGTPYYARPLSDYGASDQATPITEIEGTPVYARPDAVVVVIPAKSTELTRQEPISDILEPGFAHEYTFYGRLGEEVAVGIQFFSPTAQRVGRNIAILDPDGLDAEPLCQRDHILQGDNGVVLSCSVVKEGQWRVRLFGREGESSGAYVIAIENFT